MFITIPPDFSMSAEGSSKSTSADGTCTDGTSTSISVERRSIEGVFTSAVEISTDGTVTLGRLMSPDSFPAEEASGSATSADGRLQ